MTSNEFKTGRYQRKYNICQEKQNIWNFFHFVHDSKKKKGKKTKDISKHFCYFGTISVSVNSNLKPKHLSGNLKGSLFSSNVV